MMDTMPTESKQIAEYIDRPPAEVYDYASNPANLPHWAPGLGTAVEEVDGRWYVDTPGGRVAVAFAPRNDFGVLDHHVTLPSGEVVYIPMRVMAYETGSEVVFTLRRLAGMTDDEFARDEGLVTADMARLKRILEGAG
jgi:uncharacterized protein YndB with AHSA1/START domain